MCHQISFWYKALDLAIPKAVTMTGGNYLSPQMHVPDTMTVVMQQPEKILFTWNSMFTSASGRCFLLTVPSARGIPWSNSIMSCWIMLNHFGSG